MNNQPEFRITNQAEFKSNPEAEKDFQKLYEESASDNPIQMELDQSLKNQLESLAGMKALEKVQAVDFESEDIRG